MFLSRHRTVLLSVRREHVPHVRTLKVFQCLIVTGENDGEERMRDATEFCVTDEQWRMVCDRHRHLSCYVPEDGEQLPSV